MVGQRVGIVVVAYNAASTLRATLDRIPREFAETLAEVIILDDASVDTTTHQATSWASGCPIATTHVVTHHRNLGYGGNQKAAYEVALEHGLDVVVLLHADGQYAPEHLPRLVAPILAGSADAVFGSRMLEPGAARRGGMPRYKCLGNKILTAMENRALGTSLSEFHSGFRAYSVAALRAIPWEYNSDGFDFDTQIIIQLVDADMRLAEVDIPTYYGDEICYVNGLKYAWDVTRDVLEYRLSKMGLGSSPWIPGDRGYAIKEGEGASHSVILAQLTGLAPGRVLDVGCSGGDLAAEMASLGHTVVGVDRIEVLGVRERVAEFHVVDLAHESLGEDVGTFDTIVLGDVLEHLPEPLVVLRGLLRHLRPGGHVIISVPNFGHWYPRARAASGAFGYDRRGILDRTHLQFFTRRSLRRMLRRAGLLVHTEEFTSTPLLDGSRSPVARLVKGCERLFIRLRPQLFAYQFVVRAEPRRLGVTVHSFESAAA